MSCSQSDLDVHRYFFSLVAAEKKTVKDVHEFFDQLFPENIKSPDRTASFDQICSSFVPDYNLIVNSELHVLQIHRLVWLAAVRATQRQRSNDRNQRRTQPEQLFINALEEIVQKPIRLNWKRICRFLGFTHSCLDR